MALYKFGVQRRLGTKLGVTKNCDKSIQLHKKLEKKQNLDI